MKALVTGGAGFIGSHLCRRLLEDGRRVTVIDNLSTGSRGNIECCLDRPGFDFVEGDACDRVVMEDLVAGCDVVFHLAAAVGVQLIVDQPVHTIETNIHATEIVLELADKYRKKVLLASTSEVYGKSEQVPFHEDDDSVLGSTRFSRWSYACSKAIDEFLGFAYYDQFGLEVVVARLFNTIGPRQTGQYGMVVPRFVERAIKGEDIAIYGTGLQTRCFCYVGDVVDALIRLVQTEGIAGKIYNIGSDEEITIEALADLIIAKAGSTSKKKFISYEEAYGRSFDDMLRRVPSLERIKEAIQYGPIKMLDETLDIIIDYWRNVL
ncbi:MAG: NAD-dependent epimerase/dehydratase family protein [Planctomycetes bacterium]|nr:NAD-dependent epimerase/dehydratase family protein [Planctomycetota bacterium]